MQNIPSAHDPSAFHSNEDAKHKYISDSDDDQKGNKKQGKRQGKQGKKRKLQTKDVASEDNVKKTKQGRGKGRDKTSTHVQPSSAPSSSQSAQGQGTSTLTSSQAAQGKTGQSSPYSPQVQDAYEAKIFNNEVPTVVLYHESMDLCYPEKCRKKWNQRFMRHLHNMLFCMKTFRILQ